MVGIAEDTTGAVNSALDQFEAIDEIAIAAVPGLQGTGVQAAVKEHCEKMEDRVAILDPPATAKPNDAVTALKPFDSDYAALYLPWLLVFDPTNPKVPRAVPPSGHIAGIYARVDGQRGVFKAPANEVIAGAVGLAQPISKNQQNGLNKDGINCIRNFNGNIRVWGHARWVEMPMVNSNISVRGDCLTICANRSTKAPNGQYLNPTHRNCGREFAAALPPFDCSMAQWGTVW